MIDSNTADEAYSRFELGLKHLTYDKGEKHLSKACLVCDRLLEWNDDDLISSSRLEALSSRFRGETPFFSTINQRVLEELKSQYTYKGPGQQPWMDAMYLSPRGYYQDDKVGFQCCKICTATLNTKEKPYRIKLPWFSTANGCLFGHAPRELTDLNHVELALVSMARTNKHVFSFYGGAHKSMRGWHNLYENDVEGIARTINQVSNYGGQNNIVCLLLGPFTPFQKQYAKNKMSVRTDLVLLALCWLKRNNHLYQNVRIPNQDDIEQPLLIDDSENVESVDTNIESRMEYTVVFPGTDSFSPTNGGCMNQQAFLMETIDAMDTTTETSIISRPTQNRLIDYEGDALLRAFPLQFPYGVGLPPERPYNGKDRKRDAVSKLCYLQHLQHLSIRFFHRSDFILVLHNMYEKQRAVSVAFLRCKNNVGNESMAERFSEITVPQLQNAISRTQTGLPIADRNTREFIGSIDAVCKSMGHTNDAAKTARLKMLSDAVRFGTSAVFFTVTPDDSNCLRIRVYAEHKADRLPHIFSATDEQVKADYDFSVKIRQDYPGLCAFDFQQITELFIEWILGWDRKNRVSKPDGGAFGVLDAWNAAVEEQGRKTLHSHWLLYVRDWSSLLHGLYSPDKRKRSKAAKQLRNYIDNIISTKLFGLDQHLAARAYRHDCVVKNPPLPTPCENQDLRNLRYKHGESSFKKDNILMCGECKKTFTTQELVDNVLSGWFGNSLGVLEYRMRLMVKLASSQLRPRDEYDNLMYEFTTQALTNLHASSHVNTCFKKGFECRSKLPQRPCQTTRVHFYEDKPMQWWSWFGVMAERQPFTIETQRHIFDVFMNQYHGRLSTILGCNTNVQCGMGGGSVMYMTLYASKSTQPEDRYAYCRVAKTLYKRIRRTEENAADGIQIDNPFQEGYRRLLSAVLSQTESTVVSGPMAWFLMRNESRFLFSHDHVFVSFKNLLGGSVLPRINNIGSSAFVVNKIHDYIYRPRELDKLNLYDFVAGYDVKSISTRNEDDIMRFSSKDHPLHNLQGVCERSNIVTPLVSFLDFPNSSEFSGSILETDGETNPAMIKYAKAVLCLFIPFRDEKQFNESDQEQSYVQQLRERISTGALSAQSVARLQNIQDCHNMMKVGRPDDVLERITDALPDPISSQHYDHDTETQMDIENHIEIHLTELLADLDADNVINDSSPIVSLNQFRKNGKDKCGFKGIRANSVDVNSCVFQMHNSHAEARILQNDDLVNENPDDDVDNLPPNPTRTTHTDQNVTKQRLTALSIEVVRRHVQHIEEVSGVIPNGTTESIRKWGERMFIDSETQAIDESQKRAFEVIVSMFVITFHEEAERNEGKHDVGTQDPKNRSKYHKLLRELKKLSGMKKSRQLILFMTGMGGSGKTRVINAVMAYAKGFCKALNYMFDKRMIVLTALTGVAATLINGETTHSAAKLNFKLIKNEHIEEWKNARLVIVDEISFASKADLEKLNARLQDLMETIGEKYGNLHIAFLGDFAQLHPVSGNPLFYETNFALWHDWVNCYIELTGQHRFKKDPNYGAIMKRIHDGCATDDDIDLLNSRVLDGDHPDAPTMKDLPENMAYAAYRNVDKSAINNGVFAEHIKKTHSTNPLEPLPFHTLIIRSDDLTWKSNQKPFGKRARHTLWSECSDCDIKTTGEHGKFIDTFLKLTTKMPLMYTENHDVSNGIANGTLCFLSKVVLHTNVTESDFSSTNVDGYYVRTIDASKVDYLLCQIDGSNRMFKVKADHVSCKINFPIQLIPGQKIRKIVRASVNRFPVLANHATTGHKLQGQTKESLFISDWHYGSNWPYVVLSRVTTLKGLFLLKPLRKDVDFSQDSRLGRMLTKMRSKTPDQYDSDEA